MKLFVAGLPYDMDDQELKEIFAEYGEVKSAKIVNDRDSGKSRGFGFVEYAEEAAAQGAMKALNGASLSGRTMTVKVAEDRPGGGAKGGGNRNFSGGGFNRGNKDRNRF